MRLLNGLVWIRSSYEQQIFIARCNGTKLNNFSTLGSSIIQGVTEGTDQTSGGCSLC